MTPDNPYVTPVKPVRISLADGSRREESVMVAREEMLVINVGEVGEYSLMCTPNDARALAVGFAFTEGLISGKEDIALLHQCADEPGSIQLRLENPGRVAKKGRNLVVASSCGLCGGRQAVADILAGLDRVGETLTLAPALLARSQQALVAGQEIFRCTGGTHAAAIFNAQGKVQAMSEDIGRHCALDKAIGRMILAGRSPAGCGVALSGRVSLELVAKAARAGIEVIAAVSAPTSLALEAAERCNITVCCFVRGERATVFTHGRRILADEE